MSEKEIGEVTHFYSHINVAVVKLSGKVKKGDKIKIKGHTTSLEQKIESMQMDHKDITGAKKGQEIGLKVKDRVREQDKVFME